MGLYDRDYMHDRWVKNGVAFAKLKEKPTRSDFRGVPPPVDPKYRTERLRPLRCVSSSASFDRTASAFHHIFGGPPVSKIDPDSFRAFAEPVKSKPRKLLNFWAWFFGVFCVLLLLVLAKELSKH